VVDHDFLLGAVIDASQDECMGNDPGQQSGLDSATSVVLTEKPFGRPAVGGP
jgi:hypothetical protein